MIAIIMMDVFRIRFQFTDVAAATEASLLVGYNKKMICKWRHEFSEQWYVSRIRKWQAQSSICS